MKRFPQVFFCVCAFALTGECWAQAPTTARTAAEILETVRKATGGDAWNQFAECKSEGTITFAGKNGTIVYTENLRTGANASLASIPDLGVHQGHGGSPEGAWQRDDEGYISLRPHGDEWQVDDLYLTRRAYWQPNFGGATARVLESVTENETVTFDRVEFEVPGGHGFTLWVNHANHLIERVVSDASTTFLSDYRRVDGVLLPFKELKGSGDQELVLTASKRTLLKDAQEKDFAIPYQKDYDMPASGKVTVAAENGVVFHAKFNGKGPYGVLFDTGSVNLMSADFAKQLGLRVETNSRKIGAGGGPVDAKTAHVDSLQIGELVVHDQEFFVIDIPPDAQGAPLAAVGYELMRRFAVKVDYEHEQLTFQDAPTFKYSGDAVKVPLIIDGNMFEASGTVDDLAGTFMVDTGNEVGFDLDPQFVSEYNLIQRLGAHYHGYSGKGFGGPTPEAYYARVETVRIGDAEVHNVIANMGTGESVDGKLAGNIGRTLLRQFNITFDAMRGAMYLEKNANWGKPDVFNRAGIMVDPTPEGQKVMTVLPGSPAESAGIGVGDLITRIDGRAPEDDINDRAFLQPVGTRVKVSLKRGDSVKEVQITLRELL